MSDYESETPLTDLPQILIGGTRKNHMNVLSIGLNILSSVGSLVLGKVQFPVIAGVLN